jgi:hypothetical protein
MNTQYPTDELTWTLDIPCWILDIPYLNNPSPHPNLFQTCFYLREYESSVLKKIE